MSIENAEESEVDASGAEVDTPQRGKLCLAPIINLFSFNHSVVKFLVFSQPCMTLEPGGILILYFP